MVSVGWLSTVSRIGDASHIRWQYGYTVVNGQPYLNAVDVPNPDTELGSSSTSTASTQFTSDGKVASMTDADGNQRFYTYSPGATTVSVYDSLGNATETWTQKYDPNHFNVDTGIVDAKGNSTTLTYADSTTDPNNPYNPYCVVSATNKNGQAVSSTHDNYGNILTTTGLRADETQYSYDPAFPLGQVSAISPGSNQTGINGTFPKTPTTVLYFGVVWSNPCRHHAGHK